MLAEYITVTKIETKQRCWCFTSHLTTQNILIKYIIVLTRAILFLCLLRGDLGLAVTLEGGGEHGGVLGELGRLEAKVRLGDCVLL